MPGWPNVYTIVGSADALSELSDIADFRIEDHGIVTLDDGTLSLTAYATPAAAQTASERGVTITLLISGDDLENQLAAEFASRGG